MFNHLCHFCAKIQCVSVRSWGWGDGDSKEEDSTFRTRMGIHNLSKCYLSNSSLTTKEKNHIGDNHMFFFLTPFLDFQTNIEMSSKKINSLPWFLKEGLQVKFKISFLRGLNITSNNEVYEVATSFPSIPLYLPLLCSSFFQTKTYITINFIPIMANRGKYYNGRIILHLTEEDQIREKHKDENVIIKFSNYIYALTQEHKRKNNNHKKCSRL